MAPEKVSKDNRQISEVNMLEVPKCNTYQSCIVEMNGSGKQQVQPNFHLLFKKEKSHKEVEFAQEKKRISIMSKDMSFGSFLNQEPMSVLSVGTKVLLPNKY